MDTSVHRARLGLVGAKTRQGLTEAKLRELQPGERAYKVSDGGNGLYVIVSPSGSRSFRYDYRPGGRREPLTVGRHEPVARHAQRSHLAYGMDVTLEEARLLLARARVDVSSGRSPARAKVEQRSEITDSMSFGRWATRYFEFKSDPKSGAERLQRQAQQAALGVAVARQIQHRRGLDHRVDHPLDLAAWPPPGGAGAASRFTGSVVPDWMVKLLAADNYLERSATTIVSG